MLTMLTINFYMYLNIFRYKHINYEIIILIHEKNKNAKL